MNLKTKESELINYRSVKSFRSRRVHIPENDWNIIAEDISIYNQMLRKAIHLLKYYPANTTDSDEQSVYKILKAEFGENGLGVKSYTISDVLQKAKAMIKSYKEARKLKIKTLYDKEKSLKSKIVKEEKRLKSYCSIKNQLINESKKKCKNPDYKMHIKLPKGYSNFIHYNAESGEWTVRYKRKYSIYANTYLFELNYLNPKIKQIKTRINAISNRLVHVNTDLKKLDADENYHICLGGGKDFFKKQNTVYQNCHDVWQSVYRKNRNKSILISGNKNANGGNYTCRYDASRHVLKYLPIRKSGIGKEAEKNIIEIPCAFPYGQKVIDEASVHGGDYKNTPVSWVLEITQQSITVHCLVKPKKKEAIVYGVLNGVIGIDMNYDNLAFVETDECGNLIRHKILKTPIFRKTAEQTKHIISNVFEQIFKESLRTGKPVVMENLSIRNESRIERYGHKIKNQKLSSFASTLMMETAKAKSSKYGVDLIFICPYATSQIGKAKYMARYGLSVHESAAFTIARRGMKLKEKLPTYYFERIDVCKKDLSSLKQWTSILSDIKKETPREIQLRNSSKLSLNSNIETF